MVLKGVLAAVLCAAALAGGSARADEYRPEEFLKLDLSKAVLSPKPLGPAAQFEPMRVEANTSPQSKTVQVVAAPVPVDAGPKHAKHVTVVRQAAKTKTAHARFEKPRAPAQTKLVRRHTNPLDAQASDTRIQVWPCRSGGICNWQR
jgi:hypothetical protein